MRYNRDDYSACDWKATKSDVLRNKKSIAKERKITLASVLGVFLLLVVIMLTLDSIIRGIV